MGPIAKAVMDVIDVFIDDPEDALGASFEIAYAVGEAAKNIRVENVQRYVDSANL